MSGTARSTQARPIDVESREVFSDAAIAVGMADAEAALETCRKLLRIEEAGGRITFLDDLMGHRTTVSRAPQESTDGIFRGRPIEARFAGRCAVCSGGIPVGSAILYSPEARKAAHLQCGQVSR